MSSVSAFFRERDGLRERSDGKPWNIVKTTKFLEVSQQAFEGKNNVFLNIWHLHVRLGWNREKGKGFAIFHVCGAPTRDQVVGKNFTSPLTEFCWEISRIGSFYWDVEENKKKVTLDDINFLSLSWCALEFAAQRHLTNLFEVRFYLLGSFYHFVKW